MAVMLIGIFALIIGAVMSLKFYNLVDAGMILSIIGIFLLIAGAIAPREAEEAEAESKYPTAGIVDKMAKAAVNERKIEAVTAEVVAVADFPDDEVLQADEGEIDLLARLITAEVGYSQNYDPLEYEQIVYLCGSVVINRVKAEKFPDTVGGVIHQTGQYQCVANGMISRPYDDIAYEIAEELLAYGTEIDEAVVYQSEFPQGSGIYQKIGNQYFCYE